MRRLLGVAVALALACSSKPSDPVERLLAELDEATEDREAEELGKHLAPSFTAPAMDRAATLMEVRRLMALYEGIDVMVSEVERELPATVRFRVDFSGRPKDLPGLKGLLPGASAFRFEIRTAPGPQGTLQVTAARWERVAMPGETAP